VTLSTDVHGCPRVQVIRLANDEIDEIDEEP